MSVHQVLEPLLERLHSTADIKTIYGDPINVEGKTIIPVAKVMYGLGGGFGKMKTKDREGRVEEKPAGESGGGGIRILPAGIIEISKGETRYISLGERKTMWGIFLIVAFLAGILIGRII